MTQENLTLSVYISATDRLEGEQPWYLSSLVGGFDDSPGYIKVAEVSISFERPTKEKFVAAQVASLREGIRQAEAEHSAKIEKIHQTINSLLAIDFDRSGS